MFRIRITDHCFPRGRCNHVESSWRVCRSAFMDNSRHTYMYEQWTVIWGYRTAKCHGHFVFTTGVLVPNLPVSIIASLIPLYSEFIMADRSGKLRYESMKTRRVRIESLVLVAKTSAAQVVPKLRKVILLKLVMREGNQQSWEKLIFCFHGSDLSVIVKA